MAEGRGSRASTPRGRHVRRTARRRLSSPRGGELGPGFLGFFTRDPLWFARTWLGRLRHVTHPPTPLLPVPGRA